MHALHVVDWDYAERVIPGLQNTANTQETMIIFNPGYPMSKIDAVRVQTDVLRHLVEAVKLLKQVDQLKLTAEKEGKTREEISKLFF